MKKIQAWGLVAGLVLAHLPAEHGQDPAAYADFDGPRVNHLPAQTMLVVEAEGDPSTAAPQAFATLFGVFFKMPGARVAPPRARWLNIDEQTKEKWIGLYALPLPEGTDALPPGVEGARIEVWDYGDVAEILHIGPYSEEAPTIERLHVFIEEQGFRIIGSHEEEYLKGPGMGTIPPSEYRTIIRYRIARQ